MSIARPVTSALALLTLAIPFALCTDVVAEHGAEDEILFGCKFVQWTGDDESDSLQAFTSSEINILILLSGRLQQVRNALTLQSFNSLLTILLVTGKQHHVAYTFMQLVDVVHQHFECCSCLLALGIVEAF